MTSSLPFIRRPLPHIVTSVVTQLVHNIEQLAAMYRSESRSVGRAAAAGGGVTTAELSVIDLINYLSGV